MCWAAEERGCFCFERCFIGVNTTVGTEGARDDVDAAVAAAADDVDDDDDDGDDDDDDDDDDDIATKSFACLALVTVKTAATATLLKQTPTSKPAPDQSVTKSQSTKQKH